MNQIVSPAVVLGTNFKRRVDGGFDMGTRMRMAKVGAGAWLFVVIVSAVAYLLSRALVIG